jgi:uncharacterized membrane protein
MNNFTLRQLTRAAVTAALYAALTIPLGTLSAQFFLQIRPAEALTVLPLIFPEAIPGLALGCLVSNVVCGYGVYDIVLGSLITLISAILTRIIKKPLFAAAPPVILNAALLPLIWIAAGAGEVIYLYSFLSTFVTQAVWIYGLGIPLYYVIKKYFQKKI